MAVRGGRLGFVFGVRAFFGGRGFLRSPRRQPPHFHHAPPKGRAKRSAPPPVVFPQASTLSPCTIFRARRTPCRAVFCSPLLRTAGRKKARPAGALFLKGRHKFALWNDTIALRLKKTGRAAFRRRRAQIGWRSKKRLCYALFCPSAFFVKHSANFLKNAKGHHKFICVNDNIALPGRKSRSCTAYSF